MGHFESFWVILGSSGSSGSFWFILGHMGHFGSFWFILGLLIHCGSHGSSWVILEPPAGPFWNHIGSLLGHLGSFLDHGVLVVSGGPGVVLVVVLVVLGWFWYSSSSSSSFPIARQVTKPIVTAFHDSLHMQARSHIQKPLLSTVAAGQARAAKVAWATTK